MHLKEIDFPHIIIIIARKVGRMSTAAKIIIEIGVVRKFRAELDLFQINYHPTLRKSRLLLYDSWMTTANRGRREQRVRKINGIWNTSTKRRNVKGEREKLCPRCVPEWITNSMSDRKRYHGDLSSTIIILMRIELYWTGRETEREIFLEC